MPVTQLPPVIGPAVPAPPAPNRSGSVLAGTHATVRGDRLALMALSDRRRQAAGVTPSVRPVKATYRITAVFSFFSNLITSTLLDPRLLFGQLRGLFNTAYKLVRGGNHVKGMVREYKVARSVQGGPAYLKGLVVKLGQAIAAGYRGTIARVTRLFGRAELTAAPVTTVVAPVSSAAIAAPVLNKGLFAYYQAGRAAGLGRASAFGRAAALVAETGGRMPQITAHAAQLGGRWGKVFYWSGRVARLAPVLNVPIAVWDVVNARRVLANPHADRRERISRVGQAIFSAAAAGLSVVAFAVPAPIDMALIRYAGTTCIVSLIWMAATSKPAMGCYVAIGAWFTHKAAPKARPANV